MIAPAVPPRTRQSLDLPALLRQAVAFDQEGRLAEADALCRRILAAVPDQFDALHVLSHVCERAGRLEEAVAFGRKALNQRPKSVETMKTLGNALARLGRVDEAIARYEKALALDPRHFGVLNNLGMVLQADWHFEQASACYQRALAANPDFAGTINNLGICELALQRPAAAIEQFRRAQALEPDYAVAHYNEAVALLLAGDYASGWPKFETRWETPATKPGRYVGSLPLWLGDKEIVGKTILLWSEQGFGDTLQFVRYAPLVAARGARVILSVQAPLASLMKTLAGAVEVHAQGDELPAADFYCPLMSLPLAFGTTVETIPDRVPYLAADPVKAARWRERLEALPGRRVGLVWFGSSRLAASAVNNPDRRRSLAIAELAPLAGVAGMSFVSLQLGKPVWGASSPPAGLVVHDWTAEIEDFSDTAALVAGLDLVISVDTSTAHLAGAMGKPVWLLNRFDTCWRWLLEREDSPWYPTLRQFRQPKPGDWNAVVASVAAALTSFAPG